MLIIWFLLALWGLFMFVVNLFPDLPEIDAIETVVDGAASIGAQAAGFGQWLPYPALITSVGILLIGVGASIVIRVLRVIVRTLSFGKIDL